MRCKAYRYFIGGGGFVSCCAAKAPTMTEDGTIPAVPDQTGPAKPGEWCEVCNRPVKECTA
jgi:hypothetical protein